MNSEALGNAHTSTLHEAAGHRSHRAHDVAQSLRAWGIMTPNDDETRTSHGVSRTREGHLRPVPSFTTLQ